MAAFVAFAKVVPQRRNDAVVNQRLHLTFCEFRGTRVGAEGAVRTAAARPLRHHTVRHPTKVKGPVMVPGERRRSKAQSAGRSSATDQTHRLTPARHLKDGRLRSPPGRGASCDRTFVKALSQHRRSCTGMVAPAGGGSTNGNTAVRCGFSTGRMLVRAPR